MYLRGKESVLGDVPKGGGRVFENGTNTIKTHIHFITQDSPVMYSLISVIFRLPFLLQHIVLRLH